MKKLLLLLLLTCSIFTVVTAQLTTAPSPYCTPTHGSSSGNVFTSSITIPLAGFSKTGIPAPSTPYYRYFSTDTIYLVQGLTYTVNTNTLNITGSQSVWFDWNVNGTFDASEHTQVGGCNPVAGNYSFTITAPTTLAVGTVTYMRLRNRSTSCASNGPTDACTAFFSGEGQDYPVKILAGTACTGVPVAGTVSLTQSPICPSVAFSVNSSGGTFGVVGLEFRWETSTDSITWQTAQGADSTNYNYYEANGVTQNTWYRRWIKCDSSNSVWVVSTTAKQIVNPTRLCPCGPQTTGTVLNTGSGIPSIDSISFPSVPYNQNTKNLPTTGNYKYEGNCVTLAQGATYQLDVFFGGTTTNSMAAAWIDFDTSGTFEANGVTNNLGQGEYFPMSGQGTNGSIYITIPSNAAVGQTILRIRNRYYFSGIPTDACAQSTSGQTLDVCVNIIAGTPCTAPLNGGKTKSAVVGVCSGDAFKLWVDSSTVNQTGLNYQWQQSIDNGVTWDSIPGTDSLTNYQGTGITVNTCFRRAIFCNGGNVAYSTPFCVIVNPANLCPCRGSTIQSGGFSPFIDAITIPGTVLNYQNINHYSSGYAVLGDPAKIPCLYLGQSYNLSTLFSANATAAYWIDWDQSGTFDATPISEFDTIGQNIPSGIRSFTVPSDATLGYTLLRIRTYYTFSTIKATDACTKYFTGETIDVLVQVCAHGPCAGTPVGGQLYSTNNNPICANVPYTIRDTTSTGGVSGLEYQWKTSNDGINFTSIGAPSGTTASYTEVSGITQPTWYVRLIKCDSSNSVWVSSDTIKIDTAHPYLCPCSPLTGTTLHTSGPPPSLDTIMVKDSATGAVLLATSLKNLTLKGGYGTFYKTTTPFKQAYYYNVYIGATYTGNVLAAIWVDWNQDGVFEPNEYSSFNMSGTNGWASILAPYGTDPNTGLPYPTNGNILFRVRVVPFTTFNPMGSGDACKSIYSGETVDFLSKLSAGQACSGTPFAGHAISAKDSVCAGVPFTVCVDTVLTQVGLIYDWQSSPDGITWTSTGDSSACHLETAGISSITYYRRGISCQGGTWVYSSVKVINLNPAYLCPCGPYTATQIYKYGIQPGIDSVTVALASNSSVLGIVAPIAAPAPSGLFMGYSNYGKTPIHIKQAAKYNVTVKLTGGFAGSNYAAGWVDYDTSGTFSTDEAFVLNVNAAGTLATGSFTVPYGVSPTTGYPYAINAPLYMRVRTSEYSTIDSTKGCSNVNYGEAVDFIVNVDSGSGCSGTPVGGTTIRTTAGGICAGAPFTVDVTGSSANLVGLTYQWQTSTDGINWNNIVGETNPAYTEAAGINDSMWYRRKIYCTNSSDSSVSASVMVKVQSSIVPPVLENFETLTTFGTAVLPNCWSTSSTTPTTRFISRSTPIRNNRLAHSGTNYVYSRWSTSPFLISPAVQITGGSTVYFGYWYRQTDIETGWSINTYVDTTYAITTGSTQIGALTWTSSAQDTVWRYHEDSFTAPTTGLYYFGINSISTNNLAWYMMYDDISISKVASNPLPVQLISFKGERAGHSNLLSWSTSNEVNNKGFELMRSADGINFEAIAKIESKATNGNSATQLNYSFADNQPLVGNNYYRLTQTDKDGKVTYSKVVLVKTENLNKIEFTVVYPNPAKTVLKTKMYVPSAQTLNVDITDVSGRVVKHVVVNTNTGLNELQLNVEGLTSGTYLLKAYCNNGCENAVTKFVKQ